ncbi:MAG: hypothetical protein OXG98_14630 [Gemmatimonadetes bacterium]|nr:hypothetical protein [Gemmatimonadota bacterium]
MELKTLEYSNAMDSPSVFIDDKVEVFDVFEATTVSGFGDSVTILGTSVVSSFGNVNFQSSGQPDDWNSTGLQNFASLVSSRCNYLEGLIELEPDWVSGGSVKPSTSAIYLSQALLRYIRTKVVRKELNVIPKIVMGPIPSGGIIVELHADDDNAINVTIPNDDRVEVEVQYAGYYFDVNLSENELIGTVTSQYASISR